MNLNISARQKQTLQRVALLSLLFLFAAHAFCFFNLTYSSGSLMLNAASGRSAQISGGTYLQPFYWRIRGGVASPVFVGMLSALYLTATAAAAAWRLRIRSRSGIFVLCGALCVSAAVTSIFAASLHTADAAFLGLLLAALAACCLRFRFGILPGAALLCAALGFEPSSASFFAGLALIALLNDLMEERSPRAFVRAGVSLLLTLALGLVVYMLGDRVILSATGIPQRAALKMTPGGLLSMWLAPMRALLLPLTAYGTLNIILRALLALASIFALVTSPRRLGGACAALLTVGALLLPLACNLPQFSAAAAAQLTPAYALLDVFALVLLCRLAPERLRRLAAGAFAALFLGSVIFSNQVYLKKNLELESTLSLMSRVVTRIEETPGYQTGYTPIAFIGTPEDSIYAVPRKGFEHLSALDAAAGNTAIATDEDMIWYGWEILGYPFNFVSAYDLENIKQEPQVQAMPAFPQEGCCTFVGETLVVKLS